MVFLLQLEFFIDLRVLLLENLVHISPLHLSLDQPGLLGFEIEALVMMNLVFSLSEVVPQEVLNLIVKILSRYLLLLTT